MSSAIKELETKVAAARAAAKKLARLPTDIKNKALLSIAENLALYRDGIMAENQRDRAAADEANMSAPMQDRLMLNTSRIAGIGKRFGAQAALVGFTTYTGTVTAATDWDGPAHRRHVRCRSQERPNLPNPDQHSHVLLARRAGYHQLERIQRKFLY